MKTKPTIAILTIITGVISVMTFGGCAGPAVRHDARVDRRYDTVDRAGTRVDNRQGNRYDRRSDRSERIDGRYGY